MNYSNLRRFDIANGEGVRTSLFVSGCQFHCPGCFNSEAWDYKAGKPFTEETRNLINEYLQDPNIAGISFLGGDPLWQDLDGICQLGVLCEDAHRLNKNVWLWSGFTWEQIFPTVSTDDFNAMRYMRQALVSKCDVWVDGLFDASKKDLRLKWRGSSNQRVIDIQKSLEEGKVVLYKGGM